VQEKKACQNGKLIEERGAGGGGTAVTRRRKFLVDVHKDGAEKAPMKEKKRRS